jgi:hypothetical protein
MGGGTAAEQKQQTCSARSNAGRAYFSNQIGNSRKRELAGGAAPIMIGGGGGIGGGTAAAQQ